MTPLRVLIMFLWFAFVSAGSFMWTERAARASTIVVVHPRVSSSVLDEVVNGAAKSEEPGDNVWVEPRIDLNGNEIDDAVGDYRIDRRGELYERHAPDTALLHLSSARL